MPASKSFLDQIEVASPCSASWEAMKGDDRSRFCGDCKLTVHNLSAMSRTEAERFLRGAEGRVCTRFFRRADGTVITQDCGPVRRAIQRRLRVLRVAATALFGILTTVTTTACGGANEPSKQTQAPVEQKPQPKPEPKPEPEPEPIELMGDVCIPEERLGRVALPAERPGAAPRAATPEKDK